MMGPFASPQLAVSGGIDELLELLASGAPVDVFERLLDDRPGAPTGRAVAASAAVDMRAAVWRAMRVHAQIQRGRGREAGLAALVDAARELAVPYESTASLLHAIARRARHLLGMDMAYLALLDEDGGHIQVLAADGHTSGLGVGLRLPADDGIAAAGQAGTAPFATHDLLTDERITLNSAFEEVARVEGMHAMIAVPLGDEPAHRGGRAHPRTRYPPTGMLYVASRKVHHFTADERSLIGSLGILAGAYLESTRERLAARERTAALRARLEQVTTTAAGFTEYCDLQARLVDMLLEDADLPAMAGFAATALGGRVSVYNSGGDVLVTAGEPAGDDAAALAHAPDMVSGEPAPIGDGGWVAPLCRGKDYLGALVLRVPGELDQVGRSNLRLFARMAVLFIRQDKIAAGLDGEVRDRLLDDALSDEQHLPKQLAERARRIGLDLSGPYLMVVAKPSTALHCRANAWAAGYARRMGGLRSFRDGHLILLLPGGDAGALAREVSSAIAEALGTPISVGAAGPLSGAESVHPGYREAIRCLDAVVALGVSGGAASVRELGFVGSLVSSNQDVGGFIEQVLGPVLDYDRERYTDLVPTLQAYFEAGASPTYAAERLHVHTNTVTRRLDRVKDLLGADWQKPARALEIQLALRLLLVRELLGERAEAVP
ncbi:helix-turn-helix domain-containing protein [Actinokineospora diospyrosa]|uniref:Sugar diacid utilization regulator n=1 Tax=Actinokineospora diospyrosa TaxID=103728 RepID=A0ABT1I985_9PSEU|nr:helix-turn-helix domain-containing protein [Actinokineospora diospyrosa]MCP2269185.1 Sugar diacid utilization regulator [Actinokineospora diospyrosa]